MLRNARARTVGAQRQAGAGQPDGQRADARGDAQLVVAVSKVGARERARLQHAVQQPDEAAVPPVQARAQNTLGLGVIPGFKC